MAMEDSRRFAGWRCGLATVGLGWMLAAMAAAQPVGSLQFLGQASLPHGLEVDGVPVGGLSALTYNPASGELLALCDDGAKQGPARVFRLHADLAGDRLHEGAVTVLGMVPLRDLDGQPFAAETVDPEGLVRLADGSWYVSSEGNVNQGIAPFVRHYAADGQALAELPLPPRYRPQADGAAGPRHNMAFEPLTVSPDGAWLFTGVENALIQDGPRADLQQGSPARLLRFDLASGQLAGELVYPVAPVVAPADPPDGLMVNGLVELLALDSRYLLALERSYSAGAGFSIRLYLADLEGADDVLAQPRLDAVDLAAVHPVGRKLLLDLGELGVPLDNLEGMTFGPPLADGRRSLLLVADDNFSDEQTTLFLAFALSAEPPSIPAIQGAGHRSPLAGARVFGVSGVVTAVDHRPRSAGFWFQDPAGDGDAATSDGLWVALPADHPRLAELAPGDVVRVDGRVEEAVAAKGELSMTRLADATVTVTGHGHELPAPVVIGAPADEGGRPVPGVVDDDGLTAFEPATDAIDFYESLEGMRVAVRQGVVVGPTSEYGEMVVLPENGAGAGSRSNAGGILLREDDPNPERLLLASGPGVKLPRAQVADHCDGTVTGVLSYAYSNFRLLPTEPLPRLVPGRLTPATSSLRGDADHLTLATYNVLNLDAADPDLKFRRLATSIVQILGAPDVLALQEVQDDTGAQDDGVTTCQGTLQRLIQAIATAGGPRYQARWIDPLNNADGGQPGGNIRVAYLFNPERVTFVERGQAGALDATAIEPRAEGGVQLSLSPGRVEPGDPSFGPDPDSDETGSRKSLAAELSFHGRQLFLINNHLTSKRGDGRVFGDHQPPPLRSEGRRREQAQVVAGFVGQLLAADSRAAVIVLGDLNEHEFRSPLAALKAARLVNLVERVPAGQRYSFNFEGNSQQLDHVLVSPVLAARARPEVDIVHCNADFPAEVQASDHDPVLVRLYLPASR